MSDLRKAADLLEQSAAPFDEACSIIRSLANKQEPVGYLSDEEIRDIYLASDLTMHGFARAIIKRMKDE